MVPNLIRVVEELPRTPNGKTSRAELAKLTPTPTGPTQPNHPTNPMSRSVHQAFCDVLTFKVPADANFFDHGGHSMLALRLQTVLSSRDFEISVRDIFEYQTVEAISQHMSINQSGEELHSRIAKGGSSFSQHRFFNSAALYGSDINVIILG